MHVVDLVPKKYDSVLPDYFEVVRNNSLYDELYKEIYSVADAPMLSKKELMSILKTKFKLHDQNTGVYLVRSGGSTQEPLVFPVDIQENQDQRIAMAKELVKNNFFTSKTVALNIFGYSDMYRTAAIMDDILEKCNATTLSLSAHASYDDMLQATNYFNPNFILGTPSKLLCFAKFLEEKKIQLQVKNLFYAGEFLRPSQQKLLKKTLGYEQVYSMYGSAETGIWAWSDVTKRPSLFSVLEGVVVEIIDPDANGYGIIAVTNTFRKRFPVFRYAIGDLGRWVDIDGDSFLELKSRETKSFIVGEQHYNLDQIAFFTQQAEAFQLQLSYNKKLQEVIRLLVVQEVVDKQNPDLIKTITEGLHQLFHYNEKFMQVEVLLVALDELYIDPNTTKTPLLVDLRN
ncbi:AMP-binding protein [Flavobacterium succinicans]|uniref:AMP-binding enzyme n=1 Tax=Flavobacterium succinicans TaxID=29536 RepID=A0A199XP83_9FLAO|nr:AMP-binding protein [Flavobacterium succinicans]OAZ03212.1 AMP-binding enzyme [Flavobacterium succinicans]